MATLPAGARGDRIVTLDIVRGIAVMGIFSVNITAFAMIFPAYMNPGAYDVHPYILLNHTDDYNGVSTFAHEWGHGMHSVLAAKAQPFETADYPIFTAEVASTAQELLLVNMMREKAQTRDEKLYILGQLMEQFRGTFYRQAMLSEFELAIHG